MTIHFSTSYKWNTGERTEDQIEIPPTGRNDLERQLAGIRKEVNVMQVIFQGFDSYIYIFMSISIEVQQTSWLVWPFKIKSPCSRTNSGSVSMAMDLVFCYRNLHIPESKWKRHGNLFCPHYRVRISFR